VTSRRDRPEELLREMRSPVVPVQSPEAADALRERTVAHLRGLQARAAVRREFRGTWRVRALVAAAILLPSGALAMSQVPWARVVLGFAPAASPPSPAEALREPPREHAKRTHVAAPAQEASPSTAEGSAAPVTPEPAPTRETVRPGGHAAPIAEQSTLSEENRLMQAALAAARAGDDARAIKWLNELLSRYPKSPLAQNAQVERFRALARTGATGPAATQARQYLSEHPNGMASDEARDIAAKPKHDGPVNARFP
jgi:hypothetical protein